MYLLIYTPIQFCEKSEVIVLRTRNCVRTVVLKLLTLKPFKMLSHVAVTNTPNHNFITIICLLLSKHLCFPVVLGDPQRNHDLQTKNHYATVKFFFILK